MLKETTVVSVSVKLCCCQKPKGIMEQRPDRK